jgi:hypothetical protein
MSGTTLRTLLTLVLLFHGVAHLVGVIPALGVFNVGQPTSPDWAKNWSSRSWLLTDLLGDGLARLICIVLYLAATVLTVAAALGMAKWGVPHDSWRTLAVAAAIVSLVAVTLYWNAIMRLFPQKVGCIGVDIAVLVCLLLANWPSETALGY